MRLLDRIVGRGVPQLPDQSWSGILPMPAMSNYDGMSASTERIDATFEQYVRAGYQANGIVFALNMTRLRYFSQAEFKFHDLTAKNLYGTQALLGLEEPWPNGTTSDLLAKMIQHVDLAGNAFVVRRADRLEVLRPDWVQIALVEVVDPATGFAYDDVVGYVYSDDGWPSSSGDYQVYDVTQVAHWAPTPDPLAKYRGMSWLTPVVRDVNNDLSMGDYQDAYFRNNATPNAILKYQQKLDDATLDRIRKLWNARHSGADNAFKTALLDMGADYTVIGSDMTKAAFNELRAKGETRIASAAGVPPIVAGFSEGLAAATYSNYAQALRAFADGTLAHLWISAAAALARLVDVPAGSRLVVDKSGIDALRDSETDRALAAHTMAVAAGELIRTGFVPDTVFPALMGQDFSLLKHTGAIPTALYPDGQAPTQQSAV